MMENTLDLNFENTTEFNTLSDYVFEISNEFERDSRRYDRGFTEEKEVG